MGERHLTPELSCEGLIPGCWRQRAHSIAPSSAAAFVRLLEVNPECRASGVVQARARSFLPAGLGTLSEELDDTRHEHFKRGVAHAFTFEFAEERDQLARPEKTRLHLVRDRLGRPRRIAVRKIVARNGS